VQYFDQEKFNSSQIKAFVCKQNLGALLLLHVEQTKKRALDMRPSSRGSPIVFRLYGFIYGPYCRSSVLSRSLQNSKPASAVHFFYCLFLRILRHFLRYSSRTSILQIWCKQMLLPNLVQLTKKLSPVDLGLFGL